MTFRTATSIFFILLTSYLSSQRLIDPDDLPDVEDYIFINSSSITDTIILTLHGGPSPMLQPGTFFYLQEIPTFTVIDVEKSEMLNGALNGTGLTIEEGVAVNDTTVALIEKAVKYYKDQDKYVAVVGHSWGAIIISEYLDDYGMGSADKIIPMEGRLSIQDEFVDSLFNGTIPTFDSDGRTIVPSTFQYNPELVNLGAAALANRWVDSLANTDLRNVMFTYVEDDMNTGAYTQEEIDFVNNSTARLLDIPFGGHGASFWSENQEVVVNFIREDVLSGVEDILVVKESLKLFPSIAQHEINIEATQEGDLKIYNMSGQLVYNVDASAKDSQVDITHLSNGQYIAIMHNGKGWISQGKFQVQR